MDQKKLLMIAAACGALIFIGVLLPWATVSGPAGTLVTGSASGTSEGFDLGVLILILGLVGGAAAAMVGLGKTDLIKLPARQQILIAGGCMVVALVLTLLNFFKDHFKTMDTPLGSMGMSRGIGLWLTLVAAIAGTACVAMVLKGGGPASSGGSGDGGA